MKISVTIGMLGLSAIASALPADLVARAECYPGTMEKGKAQKCGDKKYKVEKNGHCVKPTQELGAYKKTACLGFCEETVTAEYGPEQPFAGGSCQSGTTCMVSEGDSVTITNSYTISTSLSLSKRDADGNEVEDVIIERGEGYVEGGIVKRDEAMFKAGFDLGASYTYSKAISYTLTNAKTKVLDKDTCGYWTFIPYVMKVCGTMTQAKVEQPTGGHLSAVRDPKCSKKDFTSNKKYCNKIPYKGKNDRADGEIVFVYTDCKTDKPKRQGQDAAYNWPGVSANGQQIVDALTCAAVPEMCALLNHLP